MCYLTGLYSFYDEPKSIWYGEILIARIRYVGYILLWNNAMFNTLAPGRGVSNLKNAVVKLILQVDIKGNYSRLSRADECCPGKRVSSIYVISSLTKEEKY